MIYTENPRRETQAERADWCLKGGCAEGIREGPLLGMGFP